MNCWGISDIVTQDQRVHKILIWTLVAWTVEASVTWLHRTKGYVRFLNELLWHELSRHQWHGYREQRVRKTLKWTLVARTVEASVTWSHRTKGSVIIQVTTQFFIFTMVEYLLRWTLLKFINPFFGEFVSWSSPRQLDKSPAHWFKRRRS